MARQRDELRDLYAQMLERCDELDKKLALYERAEQAFAAAQQNGWAGVRDDGI